MRALLLRSWSWARRWPTVGLSSVLLLAVPGCQGKGAAPQGAQAQVAVGLPVAAATPTAAEPPQPRRVATAPSHGFNDQIAWRGLDEGLAEAKAKGMPMMLLVHASWCGRCKELKPSFQQQELAALSERFVMVNADQDETPAVLSYGPDGSYIPRVLFFDPATGALDESLQNPGRDRFHYYYSSGDDLPGMMEKALARHGKS